MDEIKEKRNRTDVTEILGGLLSWANRMLKLASSMDCSVGLSDVCFPPAYDGKQGL